MAVPDSYRLTVRHLLPVFPPPQVQGLLDVTRTNADLDNPNVSSLHSPMLAAK